MIVINGSRGEGGGQILRTALGLSLVTGQPFRIEQIRAGRKEPGLLRQHLTAVKAAAEVGCAKVEGAELGSRELTFAPTKVKAGEYHFSVGTAGSTTLVFQTVLPALLCADGPSRCTFEGGTHNTQAPPYDFLARAFVPLINRMGAHVTVNLERYGFYPAGGGKFTTEIAPSKTLSPLTLDERGEIRARRAVALLSNLRRDIGKRERQTLLEALGWDPKEVVVQDAENSVGPGNIILVEMESDVVTEVCCAFGRRGFPAEGVANEAAACAKEYLASTAAAGEHLADQLLIPLALARGGSFTATHLSGHTTTNLDTIRQFLAVDFGVEERAANFFRIWVK